MNLTFRQIAEITGGELLSMASDSPVFQFVYDSRKALISPNTLFLAIRGVHHDGHNYITELFENGVNNFIVEKNIVPELDANVLQVKNTVEAVQKIAAYHRMSFGFPVLGITGSNGKTILKEWTSQVLSKKYNIVKSPKSYNSQLGVPLSILQMNESHQLGIFEAGISAKNEMAALNEIIKPTLGIFTNIGSAHDDGFSSRVEKAQEKWKLFKDCEMVIYCKDHSLVDETAPEDINYFTWGRHEKSDIVILSIIKEKQRTDIILKYKEKPYQLYLRFTEEAFIQNALHLITFLISRDYQIDEIQDALLELKGVPMRLELKKGINQTTIIDDTYNNDLAGLQSALEFLNNHSQNKRKTVILSEMIRKEVDKNIIREELLRILQYSKIDRLFAVGKRLAFLRDDLGAEVSLFENTDDFLEKIDTSEFFEEVILVKGARPFGFERITQLLSEKIHGTKLEINLEALSHNLNFYKSLLKPEVKVMVMVKAFAYGSGSTEVANLLQFHNVDYLAVAYADEGIDLRKQGISAPIMVMNTTEDSFDKLVEYRLEPEIFSFSQWNKFSEYIRRSGKSSAIHLKIDTGMRRLGFEEKDVDVILEQLTTNPKIHIASIFTHLAGSDEEKHNEFSLRQLETFDKLSRQIIQKLGYKPLRHALNSPGIVRFPEHQFEMVRLGIGLYGYESCGIYQDRLKPISTLKTEISQIRSIPKGETIGYGRKGVADKDLKIATIAIGYADGFTRSFGNGVASVNVNGKMAPVIGNVCMDMTMIDITGIEAQEGDEVIIFGENPTIQELAEAIGTIPYEILTNVSERVKRVYYSE